MNDVLARLRSEWFGNIRGDVLAGMVVALALIPEAIAFSIIAGVDPQVGLYASFWIAVLIAFVGGRPGDDLRGHRRNGAADGNACQGSWAPLPACRHASYRLLQIGWGCGKLGRLMRFVSQVGDDGLRQRPGDPDLHGAAARTHRRHLGHLCHGGRWARDHLPASHASPRRSRRRWSAIVVLTAYRCSSAGCRARWATWANCPDTADVPRCLQSR